MIQSLSKINSEGCPGGAGESPVWVLAEVEPDGRLSRSAGELLGRARGLAAMLGVRVGAILIGDQLAAAARQAGWLGADDVWVAEHPGLARLVDEPYAAVLAAAVRAQRPHILLGAASAVGRAVLPRAAVLLGTGLTADCTELAIESGSDLLLQTRPAFGGNILATIQCPNHRPQMATVRPGVLPATVEDRRRAFAIRSWPVDPALLATGIVWRAARLRPGGAGLHEAELIVAAGAGVGGAAGVELVRQLAAALGGAFGASRAVVDAGWADYSCQIGQTGTTVQPRVYVACGIAGAIQHVVGMQNSDYVVAINRDPEAPIFGYADLGLVGDVLDIVPELLSRLDGRVTIRGELP